MFFGELKSSDMKYGFQWRTLTPYAHPRVPIPARAYQIGAAMPGLLLGVVPAIAGIVSGRAAFSAWGTIFLAAAGGDLLVLIKLGKIPGDLLVQDHPTRFGCAIIGQSRADVPSIQPAEDKPPDHE